MKLVELTSRRMAMFALLCCFGCLGGPSLRAQDFKFKDFSSTTGLKLNGSAATATGNGGAQVLRITPASTFQIGSAWYCGSDCAGTGTAVSVANGFSSTFKFQLSGSANIADGIAFVIQNGCFSNSTCGINAIAPAPGGAGGSIGYQGLTGSLAVEFDTFCNGFGDKNDACSPNDAGGATGANEVGIQSCGTGANTADHGALSCNFGQLDLATLFFVDGAEASTTAGSTTVTLTGTSFTAAQMQNMVGISFVINGLNFGLIAGTDPVAQTLTLAAAAPSTQSATANYAIEPILADGNVHTATIRYTPPTSCGELCINTNFTVTLDGNVVLSTGIDILNFVLDGADAAYVGFTAATGTFDDNQDILSWTYDTANTQNVAAGGSGSAFYSFDGGADTWTVDYTGLPAGAKLTGFRTELTQAEWAQRVQGTSYQGTSLATINATTIAAGDGAVFSLFCSINGVECNPSPAQPYTITATWNSTDPNYLTEGDGMLKAHPIGANNWEDIEIFATLQPPSDPTYVGKGGSKTPCSDYANVSGVKGTKPTVTLTAPTNGANYSQNQVVDASFSCSGQFVVDCIGTVASGNPIDTSTLGPHQFQVVADVSSGPSGSALAIYNVTNGIYGVNLLYAPDRAVKSPADFPIKMFLTLGGTDVSSAGLIVHAIDVRLASLDTTGDVLETGNSNPDLDFRFDPTLGPSGGYIFNLKTTGLARGSYVLVFQASGDTLGATYTVPFAVK